MAHYKEWARTLNQIKRRDKATRRSSTMTDIKLTKGQFAIIDDEDYERVTAFEWYAHKGYSKWYAARSAWQPGKKRQKMVCMHNFLFGNVPSGYFVDHINGNGLDNRKSNLRLATRSQNRGNAKKTANRFGTATTSQYKGVCLHKGTSKWHAHICIGDRMVYLGLYVYETDAALAYNKAALQHFGEYAAINDLKGAA
jgi:hypothetical protein